MMRPLYHPTAILMGQIGLTIAVISAVVFNGWWYFLRIDHVTPMSVRSKEWFREVKELEDYQVTVLRRKTKEVCTGIGDNQSCEDEVYYVTETETRTRTHNVWHTSGVYPVAPFWPTYTIRPGNYESRWEEYTIYLSNDRQVWTKQVWDEGYYNTFPIRGECLVGLSYFEHILKVEC